MTDTAHSNQSLVDDLLDRYLTWREECAALDDAYRRWRCAARDERPLAFAAYRAQLELEEHAARCYHRATTAAMAAMDIDGDALSHELEPRASAA